MIRRLIFVIGVGVLVGYGVMNVDFTDYQKGYRQGTVDAQKAKEKLGSWGDFGGSVGGSLIDATGYTPAQAGKSAKWNEGYRTGFREELTVRKQ